LVAFSWDYCLNFEGMEYFTFFPFLAHTSSFYLTHGILLSWCHLKGETPPHFTPAEEQCKSWFQWGKFSSSEFISRWTVW
jgi:hypothetical protein